MSLRAVLAHCWTGAPDVGWYPQARIALAQLGIPMIAPALPEPDRPRLDDWLAALSAAIGTADDDLLLIGHSLGALAALHWLARADEGTRIAGLLLVAPPMGETGLSEVDAFLAPPPDLRAARRHARRIDALLSVGDPYLKPTPMRVAHALSNDLGAVVRLVPDRGHFSPSSGHAPLPELSEWAAGIARATRAPSFLALER